MGSTKVKKINEDILKKLKQIELVKKNKAEKKDKQETPKEKESSEENLTNSTFSDNSIWQTKKFVAPSITRSEKESTPLERTAEEARIPVDANQNAAKETGINYSSIPKSESSAYRISSNYEGRTTYSSGRAGESIPVSGLGHQQRTGLVNPFIRPEGIQRGEMEEFSKLEEQRRTEREENERLPFMQKKRREEIF